jgi:tetratricopeptide (TPR) repeat protein
LYLVHLAELIKERPGPSRLPDTLHEAVLMRLGQLADRVHQLTAWPNRSFNVQDDLQRLEHDVGDWLDRLETSDIADLMMIGRYLARLRAIDADLVIARSILGMPVASNRRLAQTVERLAAASTDALLDFLETEVADGRASWAVHAAEAAAAGAERALRLADAERLLGFASDHDPDPRFAHRRGDIALALGRADQAITAYQTAASRGKPDAQLERATARAQALRGNVEGAIGLLQTVAQVSDADAHSHTAAAWDLARLLGQAPSSVSPLSTHDPARSARANAWTRLGDAKPAAQAARSLVLLAEPAACAAQLIDTAALARFAGISVNGLDRAAARAAQALDNPHTQWLMDGAERSRARAAFLHWDA